jgi:hypothetical protein
MAIWRLPPTISSGQGSRSVMTKSSGISERSFVPEELIFARTF